MSGYLSELKRLETKMIEGKPQPEVIPKGLPFDDIKVCEAVFQHRSGNSAAREAHLRELKKALGASGGKPFDPITVFWVGDSWFCIDGHHRLEAYCYPKYEKPIPVKVFKGSLEDAVAGANAANSKDKLPMTSEEKMNGAWRLVIGTSLSKSRISSASGVSERSVGYMRKTMTLITKERPEQALDDLTWRNAKRVAEGLELLEPLNWDDDLMEQKAQELAKSLSKSHGRTLEAQPEITFRALEIYSTQLVRVLAEYIGGYLEDLGDEVEVDDADADF